MAEIHRPAIMPDLMNSVYRWIILVSALVFFESALAAQNQVREETKNWKTLRTSHFTLHYAEDKLRDRVVEFAGWFEDAVTRLQIVTGVSFRRHVNVFLYRSFHDLAQSSFLGPLGKTSLKTSPVNFSRHIPCHPRFYSRAFAFAEPTRDRIFIHVQASDRWNQWFIRHELAHQFQFQEIFPYRLPSWLLAIKDPLVPTWWWEGYAEHAAGIYDSLKTTWVRDLTEERLYSLKELFSLDALNAHDFFAPYYEGAMFFKFLDETFSPPASQRLFRSYCDSTIPLTMNQRIRAGLSQSLDEVESRFHQYLRDGTRKTTAGRKSASEFAQRLTDSRNYYRVRTWGGRYSPNGQQLAFISDIDVKPDIYISRSDGTDSRPLLGVRRAVDVQGLHSPPSWSPDGRKIIAAGWWKNHDYLIIGDVEARSVTSIPLDFDELYDPVWSPNGKKIAFAGLKNGYGDLYLYDVESHHVEPLTHDRFADWMPSWSPDEKKLVYLSERNGRTQLFLYDLSTHTSTPLISMYALTERPQWSPDGKTILFAADVEGFWDIFVLDISTATVRRITHVKGAAAEPAWHPDGRRICFTYFERRGTDLYETSIDSATPVEDIQEERRKKEYDLFIEPPKIEVHEEARHRSFALEYLMGPATTLSFLIPGIEGFGGDLEHENLAGAQIFGSSKNYWGTQAGYLNTRFRPNIGVLATEQQLGDIRDTIGQFFVDVPLTPTFSLDGGFVARHRAEIDEHTDEEFLDTGPSLGAEWASTDDYTLHDTHWGTRLRGTTSFFDESMGGERDQREYELSGEFARQIVQDHVLWLHLRYDKLVGGTIQDDELPRIAGVVRGARHLKGADRGATTFEIRFPLWRDLLWMPLEFTGLGEYLLIKDLRAFSFSDLGFATSRDFQDAFDDDVAALSMGAGVRLDIFFMLFPLINARLPLRLEFWTADVFQDGLDPRFRSGFSIGGEIGF